MSLTGAFTRSAGLSRDLLGGFDTSATTPARTLAETLGFNTTRADLPNINTANFQRSGQNAAVTDAGQVSRNIGIGRDQVKNFQASFQQQHETAMREVNTAGNKVAAKMGVSPLMMMNSIVPVQTTGASVAAGAIGGMGVSAASMAMDAIGERAVSNCQKAEFIACTQDELSQRASHARQQVALGIVPEGQQKPVMRWDEMDGPDDLAEFLKTPLENHPEMQAAEACLAALDLAENQLLVAETQTDLRLEAAHNNGDTAYLETACLETACLETPPDVDAACVLTEVQMMEDCLPYAGLNGLLGAQWQGDLESYTAIKASIPAVETPLAPPPGQQANNAIGFMSPKAPVAEDGEQGGIVT